MNIIITMAGAGSRFRQAGYTQPKYEIEVAGNTLFGWAMKSLENFKTPETHFIFIARKADAPGDFIEKECSSLNIEHKTVMEIGQVTDGQATTAALAEEVIVDNSVPVAVYNIDTYVNPQYLRTDNIKGDGWIPCFPGPGVHWSFARTDKDGRVVEVREKKRVSPHATIGLYWFSSFDLYLDTYRRYYMDTTKLEKGEKYIAPLYNQLILDGREVFIDDIPLHAVHGLGTPEEVREFNESKNFVAGSKTQDK